MVLFTRIFALKFKIEILANNIDIMNIIIPMGRKGEHFAKESYMKPKALHRPKRKMRQNIVMNHRLPIERKAEA